MNPRRAEIWICCLLAAAPFLFLNSRGLIEPDEGRYAEMAREMLASGDWLMPSLHGFAHPQKPPLIYWATAASFRLFGLNEFAARLPSVLAGLGSLALLHFAARLWFGRLAALWSVVVLGSSLQFFALSRTLTPDMLMTFWIMAAVASFARWTANPAPRWIAAFFIAIGLGFLTKGPMAFVVPISGALVWQWGMRRRGQKTAIPWALGGALSLTIALSWFAVVSWKHPQLLHFFIGDELVGRVVSDQHGRSRPFYFFILILLGGLLPWTIFLPKIIAWLRREQQAGSLPAPWFFLAGATLIPFLILSLARSKLLTYILPILPLCSIAIGAWAASWAQNRRLAWASAAAVSLWLILLSQANQFNDLLKRQASVRSLARIIQAQHPSAPVFLYGANAPGLQFYLNRLVSVSSDQADQLLPPNPGALPQLQTPADCANLGPGACGITVSRRLGTEFPLQQWELLAQAGDFRLIRLRP